MDYHRNDIQDNVFRSLHRFITLVVPFHYLFLKMSDDGAVNYKNSQYVDYGKMLAYNKGSYDNFGAQLIYE